MHRRSQREPKKSICGGQIRVAMLDVGGTPSVAEAEP